MSHLEQQNQKDAETLIALLQEKGLRVATAESCTGGMIGAYLTAVSGSSSVYLGGVVSYANSAKEKLLHVPSETLARVGAVSPETAEAMAKGARDALGADLAVAVTGIAGPGGGTPEKPVGLVYVAVCNGHTVHVTKNIFTGNRHEVRLQTVAKALSLLHEAAKFS